MAVSLTESRIPHPIGQDETIDRRDGSFTASRLTFNRVRTAGEAKAWECAATGIRIAARPRNGGLWEYVASRSTEGGTQFLRRRDYIRTFVSPAAAARAAVLEWT
jgi:hypothetical protein